MLAVVECLIGFDASLRRTALVRTLSGTQAIVTVGARPSRCDLLSSKSAGFPCTRRSRACLGFEAARGWRDSADFIGTIVFGTVARGMSRARPALCRKLRAIGVVRMILGSLHRGIYREVHVGQC